MGNLKSDFNYSYDLSNLLLVVTMVKINYLNLLPIPNKVGKLHFPINLVGLFAVPNPFIVWTLILFTKPYLWVVSSISRSLLTNIEPPKLPKRIF